MSARAESVQRGLNLEYVTVAWNVLEAAVALTAGAVAGSIALIGFGLDSVIEVSSGAILLWRLSCDRDLERRELMERRARRLVGVTLLALAAYVAADSLFSLTRREAPERSVPGIVLAALSLIVMPLLARSKRKVAAAINSSALEADSRQTDICAYLSAIVLAGLLLNAAAGWWWADPVAGVAMSPLIAYEGVQAIRGKTCGDTCG